MAKIASGDKVPAGAKSKIWRPDKVALSFGSQNYLVEPAPYARVLQFQDLVEPLLQGFATPSAPLVPDGEKEEQEAGEEGQEATEEQKAREEANAAVGAFKNWLDAVVAAPYPLFQILVPDLEEEDVKACSWPQLWHNFEALIELNGLSWGPKLLKEYLAPFVPQLLGLTLKIVAARFAMSGATSGSQERTSSSTSSPESRIDSTPPEQ